MKKGSFISKEEATILQSFAVMLMVFHHLFGFPERINVPYVMLFDFDVLHVETLIAYGGRICISIFAFVSGYGLFKFGCESLGNGYRTIIKRLKKFYMRLWMVCIIFIPLGYVLDIYKFKTITLIKSILGISAAYNKEWWYITTYLGFLVLYPFLALLINWFYDITKKYSLLATGIVVIVITIVYSCMLERVFLCWLLCFVMGMLVVKSNVYELAYPIVEKLGILKYALITISISGVFVLRTILSLNCDYDYLFTPIVVFAIVVFLKSKICVSYIKKILLIIGKYSTYIWLTHTFFAYYYFQKFIYCVKYSTFIFIWCLLCCIITGVVLERVVQMVEKKLFVKK